MEAESVVETGNRTRLSRRAAWAGGEPIANILMAKALANPEIVSLAAGFVDQQSLPVEPTQKALDRLFSHRASALAALQYGTTIGYPPLREVIAARMAEADGTRPIDPNRIVVTAGSNQLLYLVADSILDPGDIVLCGAPTYFVFLGTLQNLGARAVGVACDDEGIIPEAVEAQLADLAARGESSRVKAIYVTTYFDNPSGSTVPADRRAALVEIAKRYSKEHTIYVLEDMAYRELRYYGDDVPSLYSFDEQRTHVVAAGTFSKSFSPGIRVGWGVLPDALMEPVLSLKGNLDFGSPNWNQTLMHLVVAEGWFDEHLKTLRATYRTKIDTMLEAVERHIASVAPVHSIRPTGGLYVWLTLPEGVDTGVDSPLFKAAVEEGVLYVPGGYCYPAEGCPAARNTLRLTIGMPDCEAIERGTAALGRALQRVL
ncbi:aminotransferase-like domain-containing protein [Thermostilla marina]